MRAVVASSTIARRRTLALVGESGCGKSTTGRLLMRLVEPTAGTVRFDNIEISELDAKQLRAVRRRMQLVFQDAGSAFNPRMTVGALIAEPMHLAGLPADQCRARVDELRRWSDWRRNMPGAIRTNSGGQRQRIGIARALPCGPISWCATSRCRRSTSPCRRRSSTC